ncbi:MAG: hypothetical protein KatS3mg111_3061 [Pirellulaceae bacterium]|nr:MAG: hypothetical protein KatS3mg111_3061 [Pirellulaceae bacterium]
METLEHGMASLPRSQVEPGNQRIGFQPTMIILPSLTSCVDSGVAATSFPPFPTSPVRRIPTRAFRPPHLPASRGRSARELPLRHPSEQMQKPPPSDASPTIPEPGGGHMAQRFPSREGATWRNDSRAGRGPHGATVPEPGGGHMAQRSPSREGGLTTRPATQYARPA